jgi:hypothetical protein
MESLTKNKKTPEEVSGQINRIANKLAKRAAELPESALIASETGSKISVEHGGQSVIVESGGQKDFILQAGSSAVVGRAENPIMNYHVSAKPGAEAKGQVMLQPGILRDKEEPRKMDQEEVASLAATTLGNIRNEISTR